MTGAFVSDKETHRGGYGIVPIGGIIGYNPGFYTSPLNTGFTPSGPNSNSIADMNSWLNEKGWYVCDGAAVNVSVSPVWNQANRYLPNLSNGRFLRGSTTVGGSAGSETASLSHTHTFTSNGSKASWVSATLTTTGGAASFNKTVLNSDQLNHSHGDGSLVANIFNSSPNIYIDLDSRQVHQRGLLLTNSLDHLVQQTPQQTILLA